MFQRVYKQRGRLLRTHLGGESCRAALRKRCLSVLS
jgi:hypothetical protein